jgi:hypothetical protein
MSEASVEAWISTFIGRYTSAIQFELRAARQKLRARFPRGYELAFDNYNALVFGFSPTDRTSGSFISIAGYPKWVTLFFLEGKSLLDPHGLLDGDGKQVRGVRLKSADDLNRPEFMALIAQATEPHRNALLAAPELRTIVKSVSTKQRSRRPST